MALFLPAILLASQAENYGLGGETSGRVSSMAAEIEDPFAVIYNPAVIAAEGNSLFSFSTSTAQSHYSLALNQPSASPAPGSDVMLWSTGLTYPFSLKPLWSRHAGLGVVLSGPYSKLRSFASHDVSDFYALRYGNSDDQFKASLGGSLELVPDHLYFGAGVSFYLSGAGSAEAVLNQNDPTGRLALDVSLNSSAITGVLFKEGADQIGLVYHQAVNPSFTQSIDGQGSVGNDTPFEIPAIVSSSLYYEPHTFELDEQHDFGRLIASAGVSYQLWKAYEPPILVVTTTDPNGAQHSTQVPRIPFRNTLNPRASLTYPFFERSLSVSAGYEFRPSPVEDLSGAANILDATTHIAGLSVDYTFSGGQIFPHPLTLGLFGQYHFINTRQVQKSDASSGLSGYTFSGNAYTYGVACEAAL